MGSAVAAGPIFKDSMENGYYTLMIHGWLEFFKIENGKVFGLEAGKKATWYPTLVDSKRASQLQLVTVEQVRTNYPDLVTQNQRASDEDVMASVKSGFAEKRMAKHA